MHELSIVVSLLELVEAEAERRGNPAVVAIHLKVGPLSGVVPEALKDAYDLARECGPFARCELLIEPVPIVAHCAACNADRVIPSAQRLCCPVCDAPTPTIVSGRELEVVALEIIDDSQPHESTLGPADAPR